ncbi:MAG: substrate-binding domain-containing protein, partial [Bacteroidetes bacterium]|nr:substrate-binding domain-containing protein [Bacteroidota bacterium]
MNGRKKYSALSRYRKAGINCLLILIVLLTTLFPACRQVREKTEHKQSRVPRSFVNVEGSYSLYPLVQTWADKYQQSHPTVKITVIPAGSNKALSESELLRTDLGLYSDDRSKILSRNIIPFAVAKDVVVPVMNRFNPAASAIYYKGLSKENLYRIFVTGDITSWSEIPGIEEEVVLSTFTRVDLCGAASIWADYFGTFQENLKGIPVNGDPGMYSAIKNTKGGIGFA